MKLTAKAAREGRWWAVEVAELGGFHTQARTLAEVPSMVLDAAALITERPESNFEVVVVPEVPEGARVMLAKAEELAHQAAEANTLSAAYRRGAAKNLKEAGLTVRDIGTALGVSPARAQQLLQAS